MLQGHVLPSLARHTIVGLGVLCDHGCVVVLTASKAYVLHKNKLLLTGARKKGQLWYLDPRASGHGSIANQLLVDGNEKYITIPSYLDMPTVNSITSVHQAKRIKDAMQFHHASFNNCAKSTILAAASKGILPIWPLLNRAKISKYISKTQVTHMGHMQQIRQNLKSTKKELPIYLQNLETEGISIEREEKCGEVYVLVLDVQIMNGTIYSDLTGVFPVTSARGNKSPFVAYSYDANGILWEPMKSKNDGEILFLFHILQYGNLQYGNQGRTGYSRSPCAGREATLNGVMTFFCGR